MEREGIAVLLDSRLKKGILDIGWLRINNRYYGDIEFGF